MARSDEQLERARPEVTGLESYRRLIELQKQMIELSQQYEQTKRERDALRDVVVKEVAEQMRARKSLRYRVQYSAVNFLRRFRPLPAAEVIRLNPPAATNPPVHNRSLSVP